MGAPRWSLQQPRQAREHGDGEGFELAQEPRPEHREDGSGSEEFRNEAEGRLIDLGDRQEDADENPPITRMTARIGPATENIVNSAPWPSSDSPAIQLS
jgi:hypothetical protein